MTHHTPEGLSPQTAEDYLRGRYGAYRGHFAWRELEEAFNAGLRAQAASVEPVAYMTEDGRVSMRTTVETAMPRAARESFTIPLYAGAPPSQASVPNDGWLIDRGLLYRLTDGPNPQNRDEISITMADGSRSDASRNRRARELLDCIRSTGPASVPGEVGCIYCDGTGDVHDGVGEWRGICNCPAGDAIRARSSGYADTVPTALATKETK